MGYTKDYEWAAETPDFTIEEDWYNIICLASKSVDFRLNLKGYGWKPDAACTNLIEVYPGDYKIYYRIALMKNQHFEHWSAGPSNPPDDWLTIGAGISVERESTIKKYGSYAAKVTRNGANCSIGQKSITTEFQSKTLHFSCWVYATQPNTARLLIYDGVSPIATSAYHTGGSSWEYLTVSLMCAPTADRWETFCHVQNSNTTVYFDEAILSEGDSLWTYETIVISERDNYDTSTVYKDTSFSFGLNEHKYYCIKIVALKANLFNSWGGNLEGITAASQFWNSLYVRK